MSDEEKRSAPLGLRIRPTLKALLQSMAEKEKRTLAAYVELVLEDHVAKAKTAKRKA